MQTLFLFLYKYRAFALFVALELICLWLIVQNNQYQSAAFFNSANQIAASVTEAANDIESYFYLKEANQSLANENARLKELVQEMEQRMALPAARASVPQEVAKQYSYEPAKVINNSVEFSKNFITLNRGRKDGLEPGMGVIGDDGVVGRIKSVSDHFSVAISLLHTNFMVSSMLKASSSYGSLKWNGQNPDKAKLDYIPRHIEVNIGDTVLTSSFNSVFPSGIPVGVVSDVSLSENSTYYDITVDLATDFNSLSYVYVIKDYLRTERDSLEQVSR